MEALLSPHRHRSQYFGVYPAIVTKIADPEKRYRVKVKFPWMMEQDSKYVNVKDDEDMTSQWARVSSLMAGTESHGGGESDGLRGTFFLPEEDDEVLVAFMHGDFREPVIIGQLYNGKDKPFWKVDEDQPQGVQKKATNCLRGIRSKAGHMIAFTDGGEKSAEKIVIQTKVSDDKVFDQPALNTEPMKVGIALGDVVEVLVPDGKTGSHVIALEKTDETEHILIADGEGKHLIKLDTKNDQLTIYAANDLIIEAKNNIHIKCANLKVQSGSTTFKASDTWVQESGNNMDITSKNGTLTAQGGPNIELNP